MLLGPCTEGGGDAALLVVTHREQPRLVGVEQK
jgi:hypothetical protein